MVARAVRGGMLALSFRTGFRVRKWRRPQFSVSRRAVLKPRNLPPRCTLCQNLNPATNQNPTHKRTAPSKNHAQDDGTMDHLAMPSLSRSTISSADDTMATFTLSSVRKRA